MVHFWEAHVPRQVLPEFDSPEYGATAYDRSISGLDRYVGQLVDVAGEKTSVILTGDHGECVGELPAGDTLIPYFLEKLNMPPMETCDAETLDSSVDLMAATPRLHKLASDLESLTEGDQGGQMEWNQRALMMLNLLLMGLTRYRLQLFKSKTADGKKRGLLEDIRHKMDDLRIFLAVALGRPEAAHKQMVKTSLGEHMLQHGYHIYDYLQKVPAVFYGKGIFPEGKSVQADVRQIDLLPTLIEAFHLEWADASFDGTGYFEMMRNGGGENRSIYMEARGGAQAEAVFLIRGARREGRKVAYAPFEPEAPVEYYEITNDSMETANLSALGPEQAEALRGEAEAVASSFVGSSPSSSGLTARENLAMVRKLKALGYM